MKRNLIIRNIILSILCLGLTIILLNSPYREAIPRTKNTMYGILSSGPIIVVDYFAIVFPVLFWIETIFFKFPLNKSLKFIFVAQGILGFISYLMTYLFLSATFFFKNEYLPTFYLILLYELVFAFWSIAVTVKFFSNKHWINWPFINKVETDI